MPVLLELIRLLLDVAGIEAPGSWASDMQPTREQPQRPHHNRVIREEGAPLMPTTIEQRLADVELQLAELKAEIKTLVPRPNWISAICGSFKDDPDFDEVLRLGKELREADRPKEGD